MHILFIVSSERYYKIIHLDCTYPNNSTEINGAYFEVDKYRVCIPTEINGETILTESNHASELTSIG